MKISKTGKFSFYANRPKYPDFYRIRIQNRSITFVVDSTETISIHADFDNFATDYTIHNSPQSELIKNLRISVINIQNQLSELNQITDQNERTAKVAEIEQAIETHKEMARVIMLENPRSNAAYFALYQQINGHYIFSPFVTEDYRYWAAVATNYNSFMPDSERSKNLYNFVIEALREQRLAQQQAALNQLIQQEGKTYIDILLPDKLGVERRISDLKGKVILIDFSAHEMEQSTEYVFALRDLYTKYNSRGFEIFQISLDRNRLLWEISTENIPWISVRDENGHFASLYNVRQIPTTFLMDREGNIIARDLSFSELDREIDRLLRR
jgi:peroxiredoxin